MSKKIENVETEITETRSEYVERRVREGISLGEANKEWRQNPGFKKRTGNRVALYDFLSSGTRTDEEILEYLETSGSENLRRNSSNFLRIGALVRAVREKALSEKESKVA